MHNLHMSEKHKYTCLVHAIYLLGVAAITKESLNNFNQTLYKHVKMNWLEFGLKRSQGRKRVKIQEK